MTLRSRRAGAQGARVTVGIAQTVDPQTTEGLLDEFCLALGEATDIDVVASGVSGYPQLAAELAAGAVDIVWLPPIPALRATAAGRAVPIALPVRGGDSSYHAALFARSGSALAGPGDLVALRAAWVHPQSAAGYLIIRAYLEGQGVDLGRAFTSDLFVGSHDAVTLAVLAGQADVGASFAYFDDAGGVKRAGWGDAAVRIVARAGPIPNDIVAARQGLAPDLVGAVQSALVDARHERLRDAVRLLLAAEGFALPTPEQLAPLRALLARLQPSVDRPHSMFPPPARPAGTGG
ncbi:MAG: phosphate/phosphite/phosphonate ABC transporter substrate-binding protein [Deltaproteobacteria bacterium]|nr:phosphate/phosphite/phosphonate ABC transporter substrate-binding protein [Deltaproteobacteria bacterium]